MLFLDNEEVTETLSTTYETSSRNNIPDTVLLTSSVRAPSLPTVTISPSSSLSSTVSAGSLTTETVFGDINLVTRVRDTVLVFTTTRTGHTHEHRGSDKCQYYFNWVKSNQKLNYILETTLLELKSASVKTIASFAYQACNHDFCIRRCFIWSN